MNALDRLALKDPAAAVRRRLVTLHLHGSGRAVREQNMKKPPTTDAVLHDLLRVLREREEWYRGGNKFEDVRFGEGIAYARQTIEQVRSMLAIEQRKRIVEVYSRWPIGPLRVRTFLLLLAAMIGALFILSRFHP